MLVFCRPGVPYSVVQRSTMASLFDSGMNFLGVFGVDCAEKGILYE